MKAKYRPEIDGLRAIAVLPVMLFHAGIAGFSGGFVGVDVFFVISGYLITGIIMAELDAGTFTVAGFYERRARRILPALSIVILACLPAAWILLPPGDLMDFAKSTMSVAIFSSNVYFKNTGNYFHAASGVRPLLHTWSLGVEEQFYVIFPLCLVILRRWARPFLAPAIGVALVCSLGLAQWAALFRPEAAFYFLPTRGWELMIGALVAVLAGRANGLQAAERLASLRATVLSAAGLIMILVAVGVFGTGTLMPGLPALLPTVGAALIITYAAPDNATGRLLGSRWLVGVGLISYSAYLWHQPLLAFTRWASPFGPSDGALLIAAGLALPLAYVSWRFVERPFRDRRRLDRRQIAVFAVASSGAIFSAGAAGVASNGFPSRFQFPAPTIASLQLMHLLPGCMDGENMQAAPDWICGIGRADSRPSFLVVGDSHAMALEPAFDSAARVLGVSGQFSAMSACPPIANVFREGRPLEVSTCHEWNDRILRFVQRERPALVILVARWSAYTDGGYDGRQLRPLSLVEGTAPTQAGSRRAMAQALRETVDTLAATGAHVVIVPQVPEQLVDAPFKVYARISRRPDSAGTRTIRSYSVLLSDHRRLQQFDDGQFRALGMLPRVTIVDLGATLCDDQRCLMGTPLESWYRDNHHLSPTGALHLVDDVARMLRSQLSPRRSAPTTFAPGPAR